MNIASIGTATGTSIGLPRVAAIVLNYNGKDVTLQALASLSAMTYGAFDLIVVDNGSSDGSADAVAEQFPQVLQLRTDVNLGAAGGCNLGFRYALEQEYEYLLILNNDIEVDPEMLSELVALAEADPKIGCVGPKEYYYWDRQRLWSAGGRIRFREAITKERGDGEIDQGQYDRDEQVDYINGCAMLIRRQAMLDVGLWDPLFHLAVEDADFCRRLQATGWTCWYAHRARLWHMVAYATGVYKAGKTFQTGRSTALFLRRYAGPLQWLRSLAFLCAALPAAFVREVPKGNQAAVFAKARGFLDGLRAPMTSPPSVDAEGPPYRVLTR